MKRRFIIQNTETGEEVILPVTPSDYTLTDGRDVTVVSMARYGEVSVPALRSVTDQSISGFFPARRYSFCDPSTVYNPSHYIEKLVKWSNDGTVCLLIISDTNVCKPILLKPLEYSEDDGSGDVSYKISFTGYRAAAATDSYDTKTGNCTRSETSAYTAAETTYNVTVTAGDTFASIARGAYGDPTLADRLAEYNGMSAISKWRLIGGLVVKVPPLSILNAS